MLSCKWATSNLATATCHARAPVIAHHGSSIRTARQQYIKTSIDWCTYQHAQIIPGVTLCSLPIVAIEYTVCPFIGRRSGTSRVYTFTPPVKTIGNDSITYQVEHLQAHFSVALTLQNWQTQFVLTCSQCEAESLRCWQIAI